MWYTLQVYVLYLSYIKITLINIHSTDSPYVNNFPPHPQLLDHSETLIKTTVGETQKLTCNVTGATPLNIEWNVYHNGQKSLASQSVENFYADIVGIYCYFHILFY